MGFEQGGDENLGDVSVVAQGGVKELAQGGSWTLVKSPRKIKENRKSQSNNCGPGARHQERGFLRYKGGDESEIGQGADVNVLLLEERNDVSVPVNNEPDQVFAPRMQNRNNNCFANTCLSILGNTPEGLAQIKIFINKEHQNSQDIELGKLMKDAVHSSSIKKPINLCKLIPLIDSSLQLGEQEDIYPFISNLSEKLGFGEGTIFPKTEKIVSSCEKCGEESITLNPTSIVTLFFMNGKNVLDEFRTGLQQNVDKMCYTCGENTNHKQIQILEKSDYLMLRSLNEYSEKEVDLIKEIENIGSLSLVGFATRKADATGNSGHWWYTRVMHDGTSVKLDGEKLHHQNNIITSRSLSDGNLFVYKILPTDVEDSEGGTKTSGVVQKEKECVIKKVEIDAFGENINHEEETQSNDSDGFIYQDGVSDFDESDDMYEGVISPDKFNLDFFSKRIGITPLVTSQENVNESAKVVGSKGGLCDSFMRNGKNATFKGTLIQMEKDLTEREKRFLKRNKQYMKSNSNVNPEVKGDVLPEIVPSISCDSLNVSPTRKRRHRSSIVLTPPTRSLHVQQKNIRKSKAWKTLDILVKKDAERRKHKSGSIDSDSEGLFQNKRFVDEEYYDERCDTTQDKETNMIDSLAKCYMSMKIFFRDLHKIEKNLETKESSKIINDMDERRDVWFEIYEANELKFNRIINPNVFDENRLNSDRFEVFFHLIKDLDILWNKFLELKILDYPIISKWKKNINTIILDVLTYCQRVGQTLDLSLNQSKHKNSEQDRLEIIPRVESDKTIKITEVIERNKDKLDFVYENTPSSDDDDNWDHTNNGKEKEVAVTDDDDINRDNTDFGKDKEVTVTDSDDMDKDNTDIGKDKEVAVTDSDDMNRDNTDIGKDKQVTETDSDDINRGNTDIGKDKEITVTVFDDLITEIVERNEDDLDFVYKSTPSSDDEDNWDQHFNLMEGINNNRNEIVNKDAENDIGGKDKDKLETPKPKEVSGDDPKPDEGEKLVYKEGGGLESVQEQDTHDKGENLDNEKGGGPEPVQEQDTNDESKELDNHQEKLKSPKKPSYISEEFKEVLRNAFKDLPGTQTKESIEKKAKENEEFNGYWLKFIETNKSKALATDAVKKFLGGTRKTGLANLNPAMVSQLTEMIEKNSFITKKGLVDRAKVDPEFNTVWNYFKSRRANENQAANLVSSTCKQIWKKKSNK